MTRSGARGSRARKNARAAPEPTREIIKIKLSPGTYERVGAYLEKNGLFTQSANSQLYVWFAEQADQVQAKILGHLPEGFEFDEVEALLQELADRKPKRSRR